MKYFLFSLFFVSVSSCIKQKTEGVNVVDATVFEQSLTIENAQVVDARTASEYPTGKIPNAINIDVLEDDFSTKVAQLDKTKPILVYCKSFSFYSLYSLSPFLFITRTESSMTSDKQVPPL